MMPTRTLTPDEHLAASPDRPSGHHPLALVVIAAAQLMVMLDLTIVNIALPAMQRELHFSATNLTWVIDAYVLVFGGLLLFGGRTGDLFGRRRMFVVGVALFTVASLAGGLATTQVLLIAARVMQGAGAAIASPTALALVATTFKEGAERNRAMAVYAAMSAAGGALGLLVGGILVEIASWRWVMFVNVPIGVAVLTLTPLTLPPGRGTRGRLDTSGALAVSAGMALLVYGLVRAPSSGWADPGTVMSFALAAVLLVAFVAIERASTAPLLPLAFLRDRNRAGGYAVMLLLGAAMLSLIFFLTQFMQDGLHYTPIAAGVAYLPIPVAVATTSLVVARLVRQVGTRPFLILGPALVTVGLMWVSGVNASSDYLRIFGPLVTVGVGMGLSFVPLTLNAITSVPRHESGLASALLNTSQQIGGSLGLAALVTASTTVSRDQVQRLTAALAPGSVSQLHAITAAANVHGYEVAFRIGALAAGLAVLLAVLLLRQTRPVNDAAQPGPDTRVRGA
ncbi:putative MFS-type transporter EfpA [mine drainage metagenome]|uniref:Putative MFS-type transporter EfpA n=1 Tax=mine drainage metagenome TaxID=410659 RepID=A0A1J5R0M7_9ZZZZ